MPPTFRSLFFHRRLRVLAFRLTLPVGAIRDSLRSSPLLELQPSAARASNPPSTSSSSSSDDSFVYGQGLGLGLWLELRRSGNRVRVRIMVSQGG